MPLRSVVGAGRGPHRFLLLAAALVAALLGGCASTQTAERENVGAGMVAPPQTVAARPAVEIEDDGLPSQTPPMLRRPTEPDDPSEPFSPNYGGRADATIRIRMSSAAEHTGNPAVVAKDRGTVAAPRSTGRPPYGEPPSPSTPLKPAAPQ